MNKHLKPKALISDFSRVLLFPKDRNYSGGLNKLDYEASGSVDYRLLETFELNVELLDFYKLLKRKLSLYIFTSETIQNSPELKPYLQPVFDDVYSASELNLRKNEPSAYKAIASRLDMQPNEILYIDDSASNIKAAIKAGFQTIHFRNNDHTIPEIQNLLR